MSAAPALARRGRAVRRGPVISLVAVVLGALVGASVATATSAPTAIAPSAEAVAVGTESSASYCIGLEHEADDVSSEVALANLADAPRTLEVTTSDLSGRVAQRLLRLGAGRVAHLDPYGLLRGSMDAMSIVADGGGVAASESISSVDGTAVAPCLTSTSPTWYAGGGSTEPGESLLVSVLNPTTTTAQVTVSFLTPGSTVEPLRYRGIVLGPHRVVALRVHDVAPNEAPITTIVQSTAGNVVAAALGRSTKGSTAVSILPGSPAASRAATFAITPNHPTVTTHLVLSNPGATGVTATIGAAWSPGCGAHCAAPFSVAVPAGGTTSLQVAPSDRVPVGVVMASHLVAASPGLVVVQNVRSLHTFGQSAPIDDPSGSGAASLVLLDPTGSGFSRVTITNAGASVAHVTLAAPGAHATIAHLVVSVAPHGVTTVGAARLHWVRGGVVLLESDAPVYAAGQVRSAVLGSDLLGAAPVG